MKLIVQWEKDSIPVTYDGNIETICRRIFSAYDVSFCHDKGGTEKVDLYNSVTWSSMFDRFILHHGYTENGRVGEDGAVLYSCGSVHKGLLCSAYKNPRKEFLLKELIQSEENVPPQVLSFVIKHGKKQGLYKNLNKMVHLCRNQTSLLYFLNSGCRFRKIKGCGSLAMECFFGGDGKMIPIISKFPEAVDYRWVKKNKEKMFALMFSLITAGKREEAEFVAYLLMKKKNICW